VFIRLAHTLFPATVGWLPVGVGTRPVFLRPTER